MANMWIPACCGNLNYCLTLENEPNPSIFIFIQMKENALVYNSRRQRNL